MDIIDQISLYIDQGDDEKVAELTRMAIEQKITAKKAYRVNLNRYSKSLK